MAKGSPQFRHLASLSSVTAARSFSLVNEAFPDFYDIMRTRSVSCSQIKTTMVSGLYAILFISLSLFIRSLQVKKVMAQHTSYQKKPSWRWTMKQNTGCVLPQPWWSSSLPPFRLLMKKFGSRSKVCITTRQASVEGRRCMLWPGFCRQADDDKDRCCRRLFS